MFLTTVCFLLSTGKIGNEDEEYTEDPDDAVSDGRHAKKPCVRVAEIPSFPPKITTKDGCQFTKWQFGQVVEYIQSVR